MGEDDALGVRGGARGIADVRGVVAAERVPGLRDRAGVRCEVRVAAREQRREGDGLRARLADVVQDDHRLDGGQLGEEAEHLAGLRARRDHHPAPGVRQPEAQLRQLVDLDGDRHVDRAGVQDPQLRDGPVAPSLGDQGDTIALSEAEVHQAGGAPVHERTQLGVGRALPGAALLLVDQDLCGVALDG